MLIPMETFKGGISCTGQKPPCRGLVTRKAMFTLYADYTMTSSSAFKIRRLWLNGWLLHK